MNKPHGGLNRGFKVFYKSSLLQQNETVKMQPFFFRQKWGSAKLTHFSCAEQKLYRAVSCPLHRSYIYIFILIAWDQAPQWGSKTKTGSNSKNIGERSEPSGGLERGKGGGAWRHAAGRSMIADFGIMLWLVECLHANRFAVLLIVSCSFNVTLLLFWKIFFKTPIQISLRDLSFIARLQEEQKICPWSVAKRKTKHSKYRASLILSCDSPRSHF